MNMNEKDLKELKVELELQVQFEKETGEKPINSQGEFDIDYVSWLEKRVANSGPVCEKTIYVYKVWDNHDNVMCLVCDDFNTPAQVIGMIDQAGNKAPYFESEAYHLQTYAQENGLHYRKTEKTETY